MTDPPAKVAQLPLTDQQRLRAKRAQRRQNAISPATRAQLSALGQAGTGFLGLPAPAYFGAAATTAVFALLHGGRDMREWVAVGVLIALGLL
jgi:hypothetical protein